MSYIGDNKGVIFIRFYRFFRLCFYRFLIQQYFFKLHSYFQLFNSSKVDSSHITFLFLSKLQLLREIRNNATDLIENHGKSWSKKPIMSNKCPIIASNWLNSQLTLYLNLFRATEQGTFPPLATIIFQHKFSRC